MQGTSNIRRRRGRAAGGETQEGSSLLGQYVASSLTTEPAGGRLSAQRAEPKQDSKVTSKGRLIAHSSKRPVGRGHDAHVWAGSAGLLDRPAALN